MFKIIVTGGSGFIGSHFIDLCLSHGHKIINIDNLSLNQINPPHTNQKKNLKFAKEDIRNYKSIFNLIKNFKPHYIYNFAAATHVDRSILKPMEFIKTNYIGVYNILECIKNIDKEINFIQVSTDEVFGSLPLKSKKHFNDKSLYKPNNPYSQSKAAANLLINSFSKTYGIKAVISYCSNNFGERQYLEKFIPLSIFKFINNEKMQIYGNGQNIREWIYVKNHCQGLYKIINYIETKKLTNTNLRFFFGSDNRFTNLQICKLIYKKIHTNSKLFDEYIKYIEDRPGHDQKYSIDSNQTVKVLGQFNLVSFSDALDSTIDFYRKNILYLNKIYKSDKWFKKYS